MKRPFAWDEGDGGIGPIFIFAVTLLVLISLLLVHLVVMAWP